MAVDSLAPIDTSVPIPESVKRAAALAESFYKNEPAPTDPAPTEGAVAQPAEAVPPAQEAGPTPDQTDNPISSAPPPQTPVPAPQTAAPVEEIVQPTKDQLGSDEWARRYNSMKGRFDASQGTINQLQEQVMQMGDEIMRLNAMLQPQPHPNQQPRPQQPQKLITQEDEANFGHDLIDLTKRAAIEAVRPEIDRVAQENQQLKRQLTATRQQGVNESLDEQVPNWREVRDNPRFKAWLRLPDVYSGRVRGQMLNAAYQAAQAPRVVAFFKGFLAEEAATGHQPAATQTEQPQAAPRQPAIPLAALAAPGRPNPATGGSQLPESKPVFTRQQISQFYRDSQQGKYAGREAEYKAFERELQAAQREGRVR